MLLPTIFTMIVLVEGDSGSGIVLGNVVAFSVARDSP
jgi:hypothetical protein